MHVCLLPTEILLHIFTIDIPIAKCYNWTPPASCAQLAVLARTCRKFKEPALDILWEHIAGFRPLISCLPEGVINIDRRGNLKLQRPLLAGEWGLIDQYARRVHSLTVTGSQLDMIDNHVMHLLMSAPSPTSLFQNLRSLCWYDGREHFFPLLCTFLGSTITSIQVGLVSRSPSFSKPALLASLKSRCPSIRKITLCVGDSAESSNATCQALSGLQELSHLHTGALSPRDFLRLASLPSLKSLCFTLNAQEVQSNSSPTIIPKLDEVQLTVLMQDVAVAEHFLRSVRLPSCRSARVYIAYDLSNHPGDQYDPLHIANFIDSLSECLSPALEKLHIELGLNLRYIRGDNPNRNYVFRFSAVAPLLPFNRLKELRLECICTSAINDTLLKTLVQSWPQLEQFYFGGGTHWVVPPSMTFTALVYLIQHCPRLHAVQMSFYATPVDYDNDPFFFETVRNEKISRLSVGMSPISDPSAVAYILLRLLPKLGYVDFLHWSNDYAPPPPPFEHLGDGWDAVNEILTSKNRHKLK